VLALSDILRPAQVDLALATLEPEKALHALSRLLQGAPGMMHWEAFDAEVKRDGKPIGSQSLLSHVRTDHVSAMLLAAGRIEADPAAAALAAADEGVGGARFIFLIAVPITLAAEYLRIVGALARSLRDPAIIKALQKTRSAEDFVRILCDEAAAI
jgi:hypothetical protein